MRQIDRGRDFALVAFAVLVGVLVEPDAERDLETELVGDRGHKLAAARGRIQADGLRVFCDFAQIVANLLRRVGRIDVVAVSRRKGL